jgi:NADPH:quinone reductase-like Zn-dependent oxidoreductase
MLQGMTAHYLIHDAFPLKRGQTALVQAAAGGVGRFQPTKKLRSRGRPAPTK